MSMPPDRLLYEQIYAVVQQVPAGQVATYGDIATILGAKCDARTVGFALNELPKGHEDAVPWQRIINSTGGISTRGSLQRQLLEAEGIVFDDRGRVSLARHRWAGPSAEWAAAHDCRMLPAREQDESGQEGSQLRLF